MKVYVNGTQTEWKSSPRYVSNFNKLTKVSDGVLYKSAPYDTDFDADAEYRECDVEVLIGTIKQEIDQQVMNMISSNSKVKG